MHKCRLHSRGSMAVTTASDSGCEMTYTGFVHICPLLQQRIHHFNMTIVSSPLERGVAISLKKHDNDDTQ